jgi:glutaminase
LNVSAKDLAVMGATLADGGVNRLTKERVVDAAVCHYALAVMTTAGLYETSGDWLYDVGLHGKSRIGGGIVTVSPGKGGVGTFAPTLSSLPSSYRNNWEWILFVSSLRLERTGAHSPKPSSVAGSCL